VLGAGVGVEESPVPIVLCVGSFEGRKNQLAVIDASEVLWRRGRAFQLVLVGGSAQPWFKDVDHRIADLILSGRPISRLTKVSERTLASSYRAARFSVFPSLHEGYGLPVVESLAAGTPVIATSYGSVGAIAAKGGCVLIDPRDIGSIADEMERLLLDDAALAALEREIAERPARDWDDYARDVRTEIEKTGAAR
jgi:glycosyltransferase involved in cell wall biosynthesis